MSVSAHIVLPLPQRQADHGLDAERGVMRVSDVSRRLILVMTAALLVAGGLAGSAVAGAFSAAAAASGPGAVSPPPCGVYAGGRTPCVAAYSTVRAMYGDYRGPLYRVTRASDGTSTG